MPHAGGQKLLPRFRIAVAIIRRIVRRTVGIARPQVAPRLSLVDTRPDLAARQKGGIDEAPVAKRSQRRCIIVEMVGLPAHGRFPCKAEPVECLVDALLEGGRTAGLVDIFDPSKSRPPAAAAMSRLRKAESAWPRCNGPFGLGAKRKIGF